MQGAKNAPCENLICESGRALRFRIGRLFFAGLLRIAVPFFAMARLAGFFTLRAVAILAAFFGLGFIVAARMLAVFVVAFFAAIFLIATVFVTTLVTVMVVGKCDRSRQCKSNHRQYV